MLFLHPQHRRTLQLQGFWRQARIFRSCGFLSRLCFGTGLLRSFPIDALRMWMRYTAVRLANLNFILEGWHGGCEVIVPRFCFVFIQATRKTWKSVTNVPCMKLSGIGPFTVFAPTNDAFRLLGPGITTTLLLSCTFVGKGTIETIVDRCWAIVEYISAQNRGPS